MTLKPLHDALEHDEAIELDVAASGSELLASKDAVALYRQLRGTDMSPILIAADAFEYVWPMGYPDAKRRAETRAEYEAADARTVLGEGTQQARELERRFEAALGRLGAAAGVDPLTVLHRIDVDTLAAIDAGDDVEVDPETFTADDIAEAYRDELAARAGRRDQPGFGLVLSQDIVRPPTVAAAIDELAPGPARVLAFATTPARALLHLEFGGFNACPSAGAHVRVWEHWRDTIGAEPALIGSASLVGLVARPIATRAALVTFAREVASYDRDIIDGDLVFLASLFRTAQIRFWWD